MGTIAAMGSNMDPVVFKHKNIAGNPWFFINMYVKCLRFVIVLKSLKTAIMFGIIVRIDLVYSEQAWFNFPKHLQNSMFMSGVAYFTNIRGESKRRMTRENSSNHFWKTL